MFSIFKSKQNRRFVKLLQRCGFYQEDFAYFRIQDASSIMGQQLNLIHNCIKQIKYTPVRILKMGLLILRILQRKPQMQESDQLLEIIDFLNIKLKSLIKLEEAKNINRTRDGLEGTAKGLINFESNLKSNGHHTYALLNKIVQPLLRLDQRIIFCYDMVYRSKQPMGLELCWATLNLLRRYTQFAKVFQQFGRYYLQQYDAVIISMIKVLNNDINMFYKKVRNYVRREVNCLYSELERGQFYFQLSLQQKIRQTLLLVEQVYYVNEQIMLIYSSKYFAHYLIQNKLLMPVLFANNEEVDLFYSLLDLKKKNNMSKRLRSTRSIQSIQDI